MAGKDRKIAVLGCGAIGSSVSADLTMAGYDITVIDQWPEQVEALRAAGLHIGMKDGDVKTPPIRALHLCDLASANLEFDIVLLAVKSYDHRWLAEFIKPYLKTDGVVVGVMNGMNDDSIASIVGRNRTVGCCIELSAEIFTPGQVQRNTTHQGTWFAVGELDGFYTPRVKEIQSILSHVARCDVTNNIYGAKWTKLIANSMTMGPHGLLGLRNGEAAHLPGMADIAVKIGRESLAVGVAMGYRIEPIFGLRADEFAGSSDENLVTARDTLMHHVGGNSRTAPIHDHIKGRRSEMDFITGIVTRKGKELGIPTPFNDAVLEIDRMINKAEIRMDRSNFDLLMGKLAPHMK
ncbi:MAG TPA: 2-dehydropantoate 2-reductase N-terminal domain-containing protein [Burkholderiales bacterium]|nr:2-dehydropantoate 2-reductase N-terminal domain-containing protein [Burkholderiales bacterium]